MLQQAIEDEGQAQLADPPRWPWLSQPATKPRGAAEGQTASFESYEQCRAQTEFQEQKWEFVYN